MTRLAYVNGRYLPHARAMVHVEDRGYQFADGVYEVIAVMGGHLVDEAPHLVRLHRSLAELRIAAPIGDAALKIVIREIIRRNGVETGIVYLQITRGAAPREFLGAKRFNLSKFQCRLCLLFLGNHFVDLGLLRFDLLIDLLNARL